MRLRLELAYDGTDFHGWAAQKDPQLRTVEGELTRILELVLREPITLTVAGRTDAGVHALGQVAHLDVSQAALEQRSLDGQPERLVRRIAKLTPSDIVVRACTEAPAGFDARFSALRRRYRYRVTTALSGPAPTRARDTASYAKPVDLQRMNQAAEQLTGLNDFAAFCRAKPNATTIRDLQEFSWRDISTPTEPSLYEATVVADAFCWSMVRSLVGCCLAVGEGRRTTEFAASLLAQSTRSSAIPVAPARGLTLLGVEYPPDAELAHRADSTRAKRHPGMLDGGGC